jgi:guanylate kinase
MPTGQLYIVSAPSGGGKTTILKQVMADLPALSFSVSHTTRPPRQNETDGHDYYFTDRTHFKQMRDQQKFLEWAEVHGNLYGTSLNSVTEQLDSGIDVILDIDVQGARQVKENANLKPISIFIIPPSLAELERRLTGRAADQHEREAIKLRLANAVKEMADISRYDHLIVNDELDEAIEMVKGVILAERSRGRRAFSGFPLPETIPAG